MDGLSVAKVGKEWQDLGWANGWSSDGVERAIYNEVYNRGFEFTEVSHDIHGYCTEYRCEEAKVSYRVDSSD